MSSGPGDVTTEATLAAAALDTDTLARRDEQVGPPEHIGRYRVDGLLGRGGMGVVYDGFDPQLQRRVAIKVIRAMIGSDADKARSRLLREARAMAQLSHPNVAAVFDSGVHEGQVYLAMEHIHGHTLQAWLAEHEVIDERIEVLRQAGRGLAAAHEAGLVHRDFKPDNVMVDSLGRVRVLDFGLVRSVAEVANATLPEEILGPEGEGENTQASVPQEDLDERLTRVGSVMGTPAFMAPEQMVGLEADARSDQFSFCVTAYQALLGERPFEGKTLHALSLSVTGGERRPIPANKLPPRWLAAIERGLAVDPAQRWPSMDDLLLELAPRDSSGRLWLGGLALLGVGAVALIAFRPPAPPKLACDDGSARVGQVWGAIRRTEIEQAFGGDERPFVRTAPDWLAKQLDPWAKQWAAARDGVCRATHHQGTQTEGLLDDRVACLERQLGRLDAALQSVVEVDNRTQAFSITNALAKPDDCVRFNPSERDKALSASERESINGARLVVAKAHGLDDAGDHQGALEALAGIETKLARSPGLRPEVETARGQFEAHAGKNEEAAATLEGAYFAALEVNDAVGAVDSATSLVYHYADRIRDVKVAESWIPHAQAALVRSGSADTDSLELLSAQAVTAYNKSDYKHAAELQRIALERAKKIYGEEDARTFSVLNNLGNSVGDGGDLVESEQLLRAAIEGRKRTLGSTHPSVATSINNLATVFAMLERWDETIALFEESLALYKAAYGDMHPRVAMALNNLGAVAGMRERWDDALGYYAEALKIRRAQLAADHPDLAITVANLARIEHRVGAHDDAIAHFEEAIEHLETGLGPEHLDLAGARYDYGRTLIDAGRKVDGRRALQAAIAVYERDPKGNEQVLALAKESLARGR